MTSSKISFQLIADVVRMYLPFSKISWNTKLVDSKKNVESKDKEDEESRHVSTIHRF